MNQAMILCRPNNIELSEYYMIHIHVLYIIYISYIIYVLQTYMYYVSDLIAVNLGRNVCGILQYARCYKAHIGRKPVIF